MIAVAQLKSNFSADFLNLFYSRQRYIQFLSVFYLGSLNKSFIYGIYFELRFFDSI